MTDKRKIKAKDVVHDVRFGWTNEELMEKYGLTVGGLNSIFRRLLDAGSINDYELEGRMPTTEEPTKQEEPIRQDPRNYVVVPLPIYDLDDIAIEGNVVDITEHGVQVAGIEAKMGETKRFLIQPDEFVDVFPFQFDAVCRWVDLKKEPGTCLGGYEITGISQGGVHQLLKLIRLLTFGEGAG
ncbi:MAG: hypothetical protein V2B18_18115 [Pseudomonadota bacterium]